jgi:S1-C subfamily serine protease
MKRKNFSKNSQNQSPSNYLKGKMKNKFARAALFITSLLVLTGLACSLSLPNPAEVLEDVPALVPTSGAPPIQISQDLLSQQDALITLYQAVSPGVVSISVATELGGGQGSGFVYDAEGHIVTNYHVVQDATYIEVSFPSGDQAVGEVVGVDTDSDLAVIKVDVAQDVLVPMRLGDSDALQIGQYVVAIGNPFGLSGSMSVGIVSSVGRSLEGLNEDPQAGRPFTAGDIIQTDAAINPGNSGGPLLNLSGEVVGVNRAIRSFNFNDEGNTLNSGIGFAVSINIVKRVVPSLISEGSYDYPYLGVSSVSNLSLAEAQQRGLESTNGALISEVVSGGPADDAGVQPGDMIVGIDGNPIQNFDEMIAYLFTHKSPGESVQLAIIRDGDEITLDLVLGARP